MAELQKGSKITARKDSSVNVLDFPEGKGRVIATFEPLSHVGYAVDETVYYDRTGKNPTSYIEVFYFSEDSFLPVEVGYVDYDSVDVGEPESTINTDDKTPITDDKGNPVDPSKKGEGIVVKGPNGEIIVVLPPEKDTPQKGFPKWKELPIWAKAVIIGVAAVIVIVSGVWIYQQFKKPTKK
ncbi:hypothetical protein [Runella slithyformis]|uniref:Uncharacterized protein n=1 Tax=Runella slithyformis (strain ATCC 29530 / DSM 19594 / LMG 11500 / NCIMB 11436 / LSU 4) TaxID=761193 RepID=A0A7U3ZI82_RUNSL|nr:hypothetical protein [Runella slithyformis]AEI47670.1 hypothetical protein Runsl_1243 [Runella slithyformis DSM 19594]